MLTCLIVTTSYKLPDVKIIFIALTICSLWQTTLLTVNIEFISFPTKGIVSCIFDCYVVYTINSSNRNRFHFSFSFVINFLRRILHRIYTLPYHKILCFLQTRIVCHSNSSIAKFLSITIHNAFHISLNY